MDCAGLTPGRRHLVITSCSTRAPRSPQSASTSPSGSRSSRADWPLTFNVYRTRGLAARPGSCCKIAGRSQNSLDRGGEVRREVEPVSDRAVVIVGAGPTGLMLAGELALAGVDVAVVERRASQDVIGSRAGGLHSRTIEILDQRGIADRFLSRGEVAQVAGFSQIRLDISDFPTRHPYGLALWQNHIERILADWVGGVVGPGFRGGGGGV